MARRKDSVSLNARIGPELFQLLEDFCEATGQPKTVAVERAIRAYCKAAGNTQKAGTAPGPADAGGADA